MVDDIKKQMHRFESLIGFKGQLDITSKESVKGLIDALESKYKSDVQRRVRLHRLEFYHSLVERDIVAEARSLKPEPKDIDDWKDLMVLSKIYYVMEHPWSQGIVWKRETERKKAFSDKDLVEWQVAQNFRLRRLEEWSQSRKDARSLAKELELEDLIGESFGKDNEDREELAELYRMFDSASGDGEVPGDQPTRRSDAPFKFQDESINDWTESYSEDSEYSGVDELSEQFDFPDEITTDVRSFEEPNKSSEVLAEEKEEDKCDRIFITPLPTLSEYREDIFRYMDQAETFEEWFQLYDQSYVLPEEQSEEKEKSPELTFIMDTITESEEDEEESTEQETPPDKTAAEEEEEGIQNAPSHNEEKEDIEETTDTEGNKVSFNAEENEDSSVPSDSLENSGTEVPSDTEENGDMEKSEDSEEN